MNKKYFVIMVLVGMFIVTAVSASTLNLSPLNVSVKSGQSFNVTISLDPQGVKDSTVKAVVKFPADLLEVKSFSLGANWIALTQTGYDSIDNTGGTLIKTAGYPSGATSVTNFGTVTFTAKKSGSGVISTGTGSMVLSDANQNVFGTISQVNIAVAESSIPTPTPTIVAKLPAKTTIAQASATPTPTTEIAIVSPTVSPTVQPTTLLATIGNIVSLGTGRTWIGFIVVILVLLIIYYAWKKLLKKK